MAKAPPAKVSKTSGQGVSRLSYQKGYSLGNRGSASPGGGVKDSAKAEIKSSRGPGRPPKSKIDKAGGMNVSYGDTLPISTLKDIGEFAKNHGKTPGFARLKARDYKPGKNDSGFIKDRKK